MSILATIKRLPYCRLSGCSLIPVVDKSFDILINKDIEPNRLGSINHIDVITVGHEAIYVTIATDCFMRRFVFNLSFNQRFHQRAYDLLILCKSTIWVYSSPSYVIYIYDCNNWLFYPLGLRGAPGYSLEQAHHLPIEMDPLIGQCTAIWMAGFIGFATLALHMLLISLTWILLYMCSQSVIVILWIKLPVSRYGDCRLVTMRADT